MQKAINDLVQLKIIDQDIINWAFADSDSIKTQGMKPTDSTSGVVFTEYYKNWEVLVDPVRDIINLQKLRNYEQRQHSFGKR